MMVKIQRNLELDATVQKVWHTMLDDETYRKWTSAFHEGSFYVGEWKKGSEMQFLGADKEGQLHGMFSEIKDLIPYEYVSIFHKGIIANGQPDTSERSDEWEPSFENYTFKQVDQITKLEIEMYVPEKYLTMFSTMLDNALVILKSLCEQS